MWNAAAFASLLAVTVSACNSPAEPSDPPAITGVIVAQDSRISIGDPPTIHVKETPTTECGIIFLVRASTQIHRLAPNGHVSNASQADLTVGKRVRVWAKAVLESCPGQASADIVEILDPAAVR